MPFESTDFSEVCQAEGFPTPVSNWTRLLQAFPLARTEVSGEILTIRNLTTTDSGLYECEVTNNMGTKKTRMNLVVQKGGEYHLTETNIGAKSLLGKRTQKKKHLTRKIKKKKKSKIVNRHCMNTSNLLRFCRSRLIKLNVLQYLVAVIWSHLGISSTD